MKRRLFDLVAVVSLVLCVASVALWVRSYFTEDSVYKLSPCRTGAGPSYDAWGLISGGGKLQFLRQQSLGLSLIETRTELAKNGKWGLHWNHYPYAPPSGLKGNIWNRMGFAYRVVGPNQWFTLDWRAAVPHWSIAAFFAVAPVIVAMTAMRRSRRTAAHRCVSCGYDLRATPDRCPECGTAVAEAAS